LYISPCSNKNCSRQEEDEVEQKDNVFEHIVAKTHDEEPIWQKINLADDFVCVEKPVCNLLLLFFLYSESLNSYYYFGFYASITQAAAEQRYDQMLKRRTLYNAETLCMDFNGKTFSKTYQMVIGNLIWSVGSYINCVCYWHV